MTERKQKAVFSDFDVELLSKLLGGSIHNKLADTELTDEERRKAALLYHRLKRIEKND